MKFIWIIVLCSLCLARCGGTSSKSTFVASNKSKESADKQATIPSGETPEIVNLPASEELKLVPPTVILFAGEEASFSFSDSKKKVGEASWKSLNDKLTTFKSPGIIKAVAGGNTKIQAAVGSQVISADVTVIPCKTDNSGKVVKSIKISGENWPGNTVDKGGADFADYHVTLSGDLLIDGYAVFSRATQTLSLSFELDDPGSTTQEVTFAIIDCQNRIKSKHVVSKTGSHKFEIEKGDRFNILTKAVTGSKVRNYDLLVDKETAFRIHYD